MNHARFGEPLLVCGRFELAARLERDSGWRLEQQPRQGLPRHPIRGVQRERFADLSQRAAAGVVRFGCSAHGRRRRLVRVSGVTARELPTKLVVARALEVGVDGVVQLARGASS
jgi:hypothetical protein